MKLFVALLLALVAGQASADCYQLLRGDRIIYQEERPPFDLSYDPDRGPSADLIASRARGEHLVFFRGSCTGGRDRPVGFSPVARSTADGAGRYAGSSASSMRR